MLGVGHGAAALSFRQETNQTRSPSIDGIGMPLIVGMLQCPVDESEIVGFERPSGRYVCAWKSDFDHMGTEPSCPGDDLPVLGDMFDGARELVGSKASQSIP